MSELLALHTHRRLSYRSIDVLSRHTKHSRTDVHHVAVFPLENLREQQPSTSANPPKLVACACMPVSLATVNLVVARPLDIFEQPPMLLSYFQPHVLEATASSQPHHSPAAFC